MESKPVLWNFFRSSASWRVRTALVLKGIDYEYKPVNIHIGEQHTNEFAKLNSKQEIPVLEIDGYTLTQSIPIIEYIDETRPQEPRLFPQDPFKRAKSRAIAEIINSGIHPFQKALKRVAKDIGEDKKNELLTDYFRSGFKAIEEILIETSGKYCVGDEVTIADLCLVPIVYSAFNNKFDLSNFSNVLRVNSELEKLPAFQKSHAHSQIDTYPELKEN
nr:glutathione S-transferase zeta 3-like [Brachionus rubens]